MDDQYMKIQALLEQRAEITARLNLIPYDGSIEIKDRDGKKYIYIRKRILGRNTSTYVDSYSDDLFASISKLLNISTIMATSCPSQVMQPIYW